MALGNLTASEAQLLLAAAADISLLLSQDGTVLDATVSNPDLEGVNAGSWIGKPWLESVTIETRPKLTSLLRDAFAGGKTRWRQLNHSVSDDVDLPVQYIVIALERKGRALALGRDLSALSSMQQRLVQAQQVVEREYRDLRYADLRYRMLLRYSREAALLVDLNSRRIIEANPAAVQLLSPEGSARLAGRGFPVGFSSGDSRKITTWLQQSLSGSAEQSISATVEHGNRSCAVSAIAFRQDKSLIALVYVRPSGSDGDQPPITEGQAAVLRAAQVLSDGFVITDAEGAVISANSAFAEMAQLPDGEGLVGDAIDRWLGRPGVDANVLLNTLSENGAVNLFATIVRGEFGSVRNVEVSASALADPGAARYVFSVRDVGLRLKDTNAGGATGDKLNPLEDLNLQVGRVPLKEIVRETNDVIERICIETALDLTGNNRAAAAEMLGVSRQSFYVKMRRFNLGDLGPDIQTDDN